MVNHPNRKKILLTLQDIRDAEPCADGWTKLLKGLPKGTPLTAKISLGDVAKINNAPDAFWCIRALDWNDISIRRRVIAGTVLPAALRASIHTTDARIADCLTALKKWCDGDNTINLQAWSAAARSAAWSAWSAWSAAEAAAWSAWSAWSAAAAAAAAAAAEAWLAAEAAAAAAAEAWLAAEAARSELSQQRTDIITAFPPLF
jgi:hypothetical protein